MAVAHCNAVVFDKAESTEYLDISWLGAERAEEVFLEAITNAVPNQLSMLVCLLET